MDFKAYALMAILLASVASIAVVGAANAQTASLTVKADKSSYNAGETIMITGKLNATTIDQPILIVVKGPQGNIVRTDQFNAAADGSYTYSFKGGGLMNVDGTYTVEVTYKGTTKQTTTFQFTAAPQWKTFNIKVGDKTYPVQYQITGGTVQDMVPEEKTSSLNVTISSTDNGNLKIRLPRNVIDSRQGTDGKSGADVGFAVFIDGVSAQAVDESETTVDRRTLSVDFDKGTESIEVVGSWAIPEFGTIAAIILAVSIVGIIVATAKFGKFNLAPRL